MIVSTEIHCGSFLYIYIYIYYGIPVKFISLIINTYEYMACRVIHAGKHTDSFMVKTAVRQECLLSIFLCLLNIDWIMKKTIENRRNGILEHK